ncbi:multicopper oxidase, type 2 [Candidatus Koribacter versatilis Ellin345]|uniref:Multicopper oxidase, type 2 n=1 Tax=Koribacter versatilis (strain Ellin345) TaxID=204669 RepID=Q1IRK2_KORVE|nr:multicopper oxidase domain-containing protein [Candidatus Koribacter versatilis]ABF40498.1 multicopper oxidase, type 2 [Candidatus Koribacter versatilis Ellin345]
MRKQPALVVLAIAFSLCSAVSPVSAQSVAAGKCPHVAEGSTVVNPPEVFSKNGLLEANLTFERSDVAGEARFCYLTDRGALAPTLHVLPGDKLVLHLTNKVPPSSAPAVHIHGKDKMQGCGGGEMTGSSTNIHFHGTTLPPVCHQDDVLNTLVQPNEDFDYVIQIPKNQPPGLYWYHPHPHGFTELQVQGGASAALVVDGIEQVNPELAALPQRLLVVRDQKLNATQAAVKNDPNKPSWDLSLNYVEVKYPGYAPSVIETRPKQKELWRVLNAAADALLDLQVLVNDVPQPLQVYAVDGVPLPKGSNLTQQTLSLDPGARVEVVFTAPDAGQTAMLVTRKHDTGPAGDSDPARPIAKIVASDSATLPSVGKTLSARIASPLAFDGLLSEKPVALRKLVFSEELSKDDANTSFFISTDPGMHARFRFTDEPKFKVRQGTVEEWHIRNTAREDHTFHIHQVHFKVIKINDEPVSDPAVRDTVTLPYWKGTGPFPSVTLRMDFRDPTIIGIFPFHCHILAHEDSGMMAKLEVLPPAVPTRITFDINPKEPVAGTPVTFTAQLAGLKKDAAPASFVEFVIDGGGHPVFTIEDGVATYTTTFRKPGEHKLSVRYNGDDVYSDSSSDAVQLAVQSKQ